MSEWKVYIETRHLVVL